MRHIFQTGDVPASRYQIQAILGPTLYGQSHLAMDLIAGRLVILKTIPVQTQEKDNDFSQIKRHVELLSQLDHPNITKLHGMEFDPVTGIHFLVMEYVDGIDLQTKRAACKNGVLPIREALAIAEQIADALDYAHRVVLHRDLRPQNVLITQNHVVKLNHFNLLPEPLTRTIRNQYFKRYPQEAKAIRNYLAPEQFFDFTFPGPTTDLYALAVLFYEMTSGQLPFDTTDPREQLREICNVTPQPVDALGSKRNQVLMQAMSKDPGNRFATLMDFVNAIGRSHVLPSGLSNRWVTTGTGLLAAAGIAWLVIITPPMSNSPSELANSTQKPVAMLLPVAETQEIVPETDKVPTPQTPLAPVAAVPVTTPPKDQKDQADPDDPDDEVIETLLLNVQTHPQGATLFLDDKQLGITPFTIKRVTVGIHALRLEKEGFSPVAMDLDLTEDTVVDLTLDTLPPPPPPPTALRNGKKVELEAKAKQEANAEQEKKTKKELDTLLTLANQHFKADRLTRPKGRNALETYQKILELDPKHQEAKQGILQITERLLALAKEDLENWRLVQPQESNALDKFRTVMTMDANNQEARAGLEEIVDRYLSLAQRFADNTTNALDYLKQAEAILPDLPRVSEIRASLLGKGQGKSSEIVPKASHQQKSDLDFEQSGQTKPN